MSELPEETRRGDDEVLGKDGDTMKVKSGSVEKKAVSEDS